MILPPARGRRRKGITPQSADGPTALAWTLSPLSGAGAVNIRTVCPNRMVVPGVRRIARWPRMSLAPSTVPLALRRSSILHPSPSNQIMACRLDTLLSGHRSTSRDEAFLPERPTRNGRSGGNNHVSHGCSPWSLTSWAVLMPAADGVACVPSSTELVCGRCSSSWRCCRRCTASRTASSARGLRGRSNQSSAGSVKAWCPSEVLCCDWSGRIRHLSAILRCTEHGSGERYCLAQAA